MEKQIAHDFSKTNGLNVDSYFTTQFGRVVDINVFLVLLQKYNFCVEALDQVSKRPNESNNIAHTALKALGLK